MLTLELEYDEEQPWCVLELWWCNEFLKFVLTPNTNRT